VQTRTNLGMARGQRGFTLIEVLIVLVILGLLVALVAPAPLFSRRGPEEALNEVIDAARRAAVQRAGTVTLLLDSEGGWMLEAEGEAEPLRTGTLESPPSSPLRLDISPLGACMIDSYAASAPQYTVDPVRCRLRTSGGNP
jgi:prepilin-type N-terminal cleavage/methylation domain-containing protein